jgi:hypothetical protein
LSAALTYDIPSPRLNAVANAVLQGWSVDNIVQARSASPATVIVSGLNLFGTNASVRPDLVPGQPLYLFGSQYPGGKAFNPAAFVKPPINSVGAPLRQGNLSRNALRAFGATQWDFAVHRDFAISEPLRLQFRAELFNVLNHPNFAPPQTNLAVASTFGQSTQMLGRGLSGAVGSSGLSPLYQIGGPRSVQFALKVRF